MLKLIAALEYFKLDEFDSGRTYIDPDQIFLFGKKHGLFLFGVLVLKDSFPVCQSETKSQDYLPLGFDTALLPTFDPVDCYRRNTGETRQLSLAHKLGFAQLLEIVLFFHISTIQILIEFSHHSADLYDYLTLCQEI
jgi:hypothetical protein